MSMEPCHGSIINISSIAGLVGSPYSSAYNASKGAVRLLTKSTAIQYAKEGIRANSVHPGVIETEMTRDVVNDEAFRQFRLVTNPIPRLGQPEDVAYGVLFLASDESSFMTGSELVIDGGLDGAVSMATRYVALQSAAYNGVNLAPSNLTSFLGARLTAHG